MKATKLSGNRQHFHKPVWLALPAAWIDVGQCLTY
jgi:hypothetical protein